VKGAARRAKWVSVARQTYVYRGKLGSREVSGEVREGIRVEKRETDDNDGDEARSIGTSYRL